MNPLRLSPLPSVRTNDESGSLRIERQGFVDEEAVLALMSAPTHLRSSAYLEDLALAADDLDFAGWQLPRATPVRTAEIPPQVIDAIVRRATPPVVREPGIGAPHLGYHRWWLAGMAGALSTLIFSLLLVTLSSRPHGPLDPSLAPAVAGRPMSIPPQKAGPAQPTPELTDASTLRP